MAPLRHAMWLTFAAGVGPACSLNHAGLGSDAAVSQAPGKEAFDGATGSGGGGALGNGGAVVATGGGTGTGGAVGTGGAGSGGTVGTGGRIGTGGAGTGGAVGSGGAGTGGAVGSGGAGTGGAVGSGGAGTGGAVGSGGAGTGGAVGSGGQVGSGGAFGSGGSTGTGGRISGGGNGGGGRGGTGGTGGSGGVAPPKCNRFPSGQGFVTPTDMRGHCYWFRAEALTWPAARTRCQMDGGDLATILSEAENQFVRSVAHFTTNAPEFWIGATDGKAGNDVSGPGTYRWVTAGEAWGYTNWNPTPPKQPDGFCDPCNNGQPCTCDHRGTLAADGTWYDFWEENPRGFLCEAVP